MAPRIRDVKASEISPFPRITSKELAEMRFPRNAYQGDVIDGPVTDDHGEAMTYAEAIRRVEAWGDQKVRGVIYRKGNWIVSSYGVDSLVRPYFFPLDRVWEGNWLRHLDEKIWGREELADIGLCIEVAQELARKTGITP